MGKSSNMSQVTSHKSQVYSMERGGSKIFQAKPRKIKVNKNEKLNFSKSN